MNIAIKILTIPSFFIFRLGSVNILSYSGKNVRRLLKLLISLSKNIALLAMTKTGTTAVEAALQRQCDIVMSGVPKVKHMQLRRFERFIRPYLNSIDHGHVETAAVFREPVDWLGSWYRYRSRPEIVGKATSTKGLSFEDFIRGYLEAEQPAWAKVGRPAQFVLTKDGRVGIDHLFAYDDFDRFKRFLSDRFSTKLELERLNTSPSGDVTLSAALRSALEREMAQDFEIYTQISGS